MIVYQGRPNFWGLVYSPPLRISLMSCLFERKNWLLTMFVIFYGE